MLLGNPSILNNHFYSEFTYRLLRLVLAITIKNLDVKLLAQDSKGI